ncbi:FAD binding domain-containing protein [Pisolithus croceorrhizus]|nr:FAD binding domain-containing protein [Pisolithus croceorrhizus]KAI6105246.1 FAD binding domain-containing protein [Pisolithus croceorrhizus]KAI6169202.1 FAD binding domain-containing protein [Pisolithus thermaeus]
MGQPTLEAIVREHLAKLGCTVELGTRLISFTQDEKFVTAKVAKCRGDSGEEFEEDIEAAYLTSADGARGMTRRQLGLTFLGTTLDCDPMILGDIRLETKGLGRDYWHFFSPMLQDTISFRPTDELGMDGWQFGMRSRTLDLNGLVRDEEALVNCIKDFAGLGDDLKVKEMIPNMRMVDKFGVGRIFVAGDAAHVHSPAGGQGMNSSVQDAFNIAWKIALGYKGLSPASLLDTYTAERLPVIAEMLGFTAELHNRAFGHSGVERTARSTVDEDRNSKQVESKLERGMRRSGKMYMLGVNYRTSPIAIDEFVPTTTSGAAAVRNAYRDSQEGVLQAGDRAPDAPGLISVLSPSLAPAKSIRMFDIFGSTHHTVIIFVPALAVPVLRSVLVTLDQNVPKELVKRVVVLPGSASGPGGRVDASSEVDQTIDVEVLVDHAGHAYREYIVVLQEVKIVVVRPDGVVGAIVRGVTGLERY